MVAYFKDYILLMLVLLLSFILHLLCVFHWVILKRAQTNQVVSTGHLVYRTFGQFKSFHKAKRMIVKIGSLYD